VCWQARRERVKELVDAGLSQRQAAKALGVAQSTINADLIDNRSKSDQKPIASKTKTERRAQRESKLATKQTASLPLEKSSAPDFLLLVASATAKRLLLQFPSLLGCVLDSQNTRCR
jgi:transposase